MSLGSEYSGLKSLDDNRLIAVEDMGDIGESDTKLKSNGSYGVVEHVDDKLFEAVGGTVGMSPSESALSPEGMGSSSPAATKGQGLKKWQRVPRVLVKKSSSNLDSKINGDSTGLSREMIQGSNGSISLLNAMVNVNGHSPVHSVVYGDSENSEEGKDLGISVLTGGQQRNGRIGTGKKARGVKLKKENSHSSMQSDSQSSKFVFVHGTNSVANNGRQSGRLANYDEQYGDEHLSEEAQIAFGKTEAECEDVSHEDLAAENSWEVNGENVESVDRDALVESITKLDSAHEELEREVQKWRDIGQDDPLIHDDLGQPSELTLVNPQDHEPGSKNKLDDTRAMLNLKEDKNLKLEDFLKKIIQADVECVAITTTTENLKEGPLHEIKLKLQQKNVPSKEKLETTEDVKKLQNRVRKFTCWFTIQLILLLVIVYLQFFSHNVEVVPT